MKFFIPRMVKREMARIYEKINWLVSFDVYLIYQTFKTFLYFYGITC